MASTRYVISNYIRLCNEKGKFYIMVLARMLLHNTVCFKESWMNIRPIKPSHLEISHVSAERSISKKGTKSFPTARRMHKMDKKFICTLICKINTIKVFSEVSYFMLANTFVVISMAFAIISVVISHDLAAKTLHFSYLRKV